MTVTLTPIVCGEFVALASVTVIVALCMPCVSDAVLYVTVM